MVMPLRRVDEDWEVVEGFQRKDEEVQKRFYQRCWSYYQEHGGGVIDFRAKAETSEDLFHECFLCLWEELECRVLRVHDRQVYRLDRQGRERKMTASLLTFFMAIAKNRNLELVREEAFFAPFPADVKDPVSEEDEELLKERLIGECLDRLPSRCKDILTKFYYQGMTLDQILVSRKENVSKDGLKTGKSKCMKLLKEDVMRCFKNHLKVNRNEQRETK